MTVALLASLLALVSPTQTDQKQVDLAQIALSFDCPKSWEVTVDKKANVEIRFPIPDTQGTALLDIYPVAFDQPSETWQRTQEIFNNTLKREIVKQWQEEILGVPLLLTRTNFTERRVSKATLTGLLYSANPRKLMYRLTSAPEDFDKADYAWRSVMQSLRTFNGRPLVAQKPATQTTGQADPIDVPTTPPKHMVLTNGGNGARPIKKADKSLDLTVANRKVQLRYPSTWTLQQDAAGAITLRIPMVANPISVGVFSTLDSDPPQRALFIASSATLEGFAKVDHRDESSGAPNLGGATLWTIWRVGPATSGWMQTCDGCISLGDFYALISFKGTEAAKAVGERKAVELLLDQVTVETPGS